MKRYLGSYWTPIEHAKTLLISDKPPVKGLREPL
jgi:hypothetical protein